MSATYLSKLFKAVGGAHIYVFVCKIYRAADITLELGFLQLVLTDLKVNM